MGNTVKFQSTQQQHEASLVAAVAEGSRRAQNELYAYCSDYFWKNYPSLFFLTDKEAVAEVFPNAFIALWENIERRKIYATDGQLYGKNDEPFAGSILTYFMSIARLKYMEYVREHPFPSQDAEEAAQAEVRKKGFDPGEYISILYDSADNVQLDIIADVISHMSTRCSEILTKFYYEEKSLDAILEEIPEIGSKDALKTRKYKCMETLRESAQNIYHRYINS